MNEEEQKVTETPAVTAAETSEVAPAADSMAAVIHDPNAPIVSVKELLSVGAHFGHMTRAWSPAFKPYIYTIRSGIHIINLDITAQKIAEDYEILKGIVEKGGKVLFVGTKNAAKDAVLEEAVRSGSFYVNSRWLGGTLTNYRVIANRAKLLKSLEQLEIDGVYDTMPKKQAVESKKTQAKLAANLEGIKEMRKLPDAMIVVDPKEEHNAVHEAMLLKIPVFAIIGTNSDPKSVTYPIPANDDSAKTIKLILGILADAIVEGKGGDAQYAHVKEDGDEADFSNLIKGVDRNEEYKLIKSRIREDQYHARQAKKVLRKGQRLRKKVSARPARKFAPRKPLAKKPEEVAAAAAPSEAAAPAATPADAAPAQSEPEAK
jgi:small subunit ribosomal protein S2